MLHAEIAEVRLGSFASLLRGLRWVRFTPDHRLTRGYRRSAVYCHIRTFTAGQAGDQVAGEIHVVPMVSKPDGITRVSAAR